ncbi:lymphocyte antigen 6S [Erethizon dorsatum]
MNSSQVMKPTALVLLVAQLCAETAHGLHSYQCLNYTNGDSCEPVMCSYPGGGGVCITQEGSATVGSKITKREDKLCLPACLKKSAFSVMLDGLDNSFRIIYCKKDFCNDGVLVGGNAWTLVGGLLFSLGLAFLWALL